MRVLSIVSAASICLANAALAQPPAPRSDSGCVTGPNGRVECRKVIIRGGDPAFHFDHARMDSAMMKRAALGIELRPTGTRRDTLGVFVENVTPKGPAENAGIVEGDRIASINGVDLRVGSADVDDPYTNGLAAHRLRREVQKLTPGSRVSLRVYSGGRSRDVQVTAGRASDLMHGGFNIRFGGPGMMPMEGHGMIGGAATIDGPEMIPPSAPEGPMDPGQLRMMIKGELGPEEGRAMRMLAPHPPMRGSMRARVTIIRI